VKVKLFLATLVGATLVAEASMADPGACGEAVNKYNSAKSDLSDALQRYASCLSDGNGHDDCSSEFGSLSSAQDDFESAVSDYGIDCD
jgi:hypothetical protein